MKIKNLITIDGPAASGKSSLSRYLAHRLGWQWLSTGVFYRGVAYMALKQKKHGEKDIAHLVKGGGWRVSLGEEKTCFFYKDEDITGAIYTDEVDEMASQLARFVLVRKALLSHQKNLFTPDLRGGLVAEGRDCGTVIFPQAGLKFYLTAKEEVRAARRSRQRGKQSLKSVMSRQHQRDLQDSSRTSSPLKKPAGAFCMDTGALPFEEMVLKAYKKSCEVFKCIK